MEKKITWTVMIFLISSTLVLLFTNYKLYKKNEEYEKEITELLYQDSLHLVTINQLSVYRNVASDSITNATKEARIALQRYYQLKREYNEILDDYYSVPDSLHKRRVLARYYPKRTP